MRWMSHICARDLPIKISNLKGPMNYILTDMDGCMKFYHCNHQNTHDYNSDIAIQSVLVDQNSNSERL